MPWIEQEVIGALERGEFVPYFQPLVELRTGQIEGFEILARWLHPTRGLIPPDQFIPLMVEQRGLINALTVCLLRRTFEIAKTVPEPIGFSVNVSPTQLHDRSLPSLFACMAKEAGFNLRRLTVEVTESALLDDLKLAGEVAADLKALGIRLALDDFGTGYSSLLHLQALPFNEIKVDSSFVRTMVRSRQSRKIVSAVLGLGQSLGMCTVAEGIELESQAQLLLWQGCHLGQGWLYERPVPAEKLQEILAKPYHVVSPNAATLPEIAETEFTIHARPIDRMSQLRAIYDGAPVGLAFVDRDLRYVSLNRRLAEMNGMPLEAHLGRKVQDVAPELFRWKEPYLRRALQGEAVPGVEVPKPPSGSGEAGTLLISYQPARDEAGEVVGVSVSVVDISSSKHNEKALRRSELRSRRRLKRLKKSEAQLRAIIQSAPVGIVLAEAPGGKVISANPQAIRIFGDQLHPGAIWAEIVREAFDEHGRHFTPEEMPMLRALQRGETTEGLAFYRRDDVPGVWISVSASPIHAEDGALLGGVIAVQEIESPQRKRSNLVDIHELATSFGLTQSNAEVSEAAGIVPRRLPAPHPLLRSRRGAA